VLARLRKVLCRLPGEIPGIRLEEKGVSFAVHFRGASEEAIRKSKIWMRKHLGFARTDFRILRSHSTWEIVPREVKGKGAALRDFMKGLRPGFLPIYMGDDLTDEPAFHAVRRGISVRVGGQGPTIAQFRLKDPKEVRQFLERLEKELR
jgi:trehalose 6-phosphate phosphatase